MTRRLMRGVATAVIAVSITAGLTSCSLPGGGGGGQTYLLTAIFPRTISLYPSSDVRVLGLPAGKVKSVRVETDVNRCKGDVPRPSAGCISVVLRLKRSVPVPADVRATIQPLSLIGERYVQLFPVWTDGHPKAQNGDVIPLDRTDIPVEPDEALAALKKFLDSLDPKATGALVTNLSNDLAGNGQRLNDALKGASDLVATLAAKDDQLVGLIDHFDEFTATLRTRESQLGRTMELFATTTDLLAQERKTIESLVANLASVSTNAFDLVSEHRVRLDRDLTILTRVLQSVRANLDSVEKVLDAGPILVNGIKGAYSQKYHRIDLRTQISPAVAQAIGILPGNPIVGPCLPIDVNCVVGTATGGASAADVAAANAPPSVTRARPDAVAAGAPIAAPAVPQSPIDALVELLGTATPSAMASAGAPSSPSSSAMRVAQAAGGIGGFLRRTARAVLGMAR